MPKNLVCSLSVKKLTDGCKDCFKLLYVWSLHPRIRTSTHLDITGHLFVYKTYSNQNCRNLKENDLSGSNGLCNMNDSNSLRGGSNAISLLLFVAYYNG